MWAAVALGAASLIGSYLQSKQQADIAESGYSAQVESAKIQAPKAYPGQKELATKLAPYLWENLDIGLTEQEKNVYRGEAKTPVLQALKSLTGETSKYAASQGLRGGSIADILSRIEEQKLPAFAQIESNIMKSDIAKKQTRIADILAFLDLKAGESEESVTEGNIPTTDTGIEKTYMGLTYNQALQTWGKGVADLYKVQNKFVYPWLDTINKNYGDGAMGGGWGVSGLIGSSEGDVW